MIAVAASGGERNRPQQFKSGLSHSRRSLVELMQDINFGRVEGLAVRGGDPVMDQPPQVIREIKLDGANGPRPERRVADFSLKSQHIDLFSVLDKLGDGVVDILVIKHGLPFRMEIRQSAA